MYDLSRIDLIKDSNFDDLNDLRYVEDFLVPNLGIGGARDNVPEFLKKFCGQGLYCLQNPNQFSDYLIHISKYNISNYVEIGVMYGGTFIVTVEFLLKRNIPLSSAFAIDIIEKPDLLKQYFETKKNLHYKRMSSQSQEFFNFLENQPVIDLILIDGDHTYDACMQDFENVKDFANMIVFHDIVCSFFCPDVAKVWKTIRENPQYADNYFFYEFTRQYEETVEKFDNTFGGFGVMVKKDFEKNNRLPEPAKKVSSLSDDNDFMYSAFYKLGLSKLEQNDYKNAIKYFCESLKINSKKTEVFLKLAECTEKIGELKVSEAYYHKYRSLLK